MVEYRFFHVGTIPEYSTAVWHAPRDRARHLEEDAHRPRLEQAFEYVMWCLSELEPPRAVVDLGAGDGGLLSLLEGRDVDCWGYDFTPANIGGARERGVNVREVDFTDDPIMWAPVVVMTEVLEHLADPHGILARIADSAVYLVASSPWQETPTSHVDYHTWAWDVAGYAAMVTTAGFNIIDHEKVGSFQIMRAKVRL